MRGIDSQLLMEIAAPAADPLKTPQLVIALTLAVSMLVTVVELVRRQKLREEYAYLWMATSIVLMVLAIWTGVLDWLRAAAGADALVSVLFFGALVFLLAVSLQFSVRLTKLTFRSKTMSQRLALLERQVEELALELQQSRDEANRVSPDLTIETGTNEPVVAIPRPETAKTDTERSPQREPVSDTAADQVS